MGIYDRDYYRKTGPSFLESFTTGGQVCKWLVAANVAFFLVQLLTARRGLGPFTEWLAMKPDRVFYHFEIWRLITAAFLHDPGNYWHIVWNMLFLWFFGPDLEQLYGKKEFLAFYLTAGVVANAIWGLTALWQPIIDIHGREHFPPAMGASGAVMATMVLCAMHYPHRTILFGLFLPIPLWLFTVIYVGADLFYFVRGSDVPVAYANHLGGAAFAFFYRKLNWRLLGGWVGFVDRMRRPARPRLRVYREEPARIIPEARPAERVDEQLEAKMDAVLAKLSAHGMDSLTPDEREILQRVSEQYKKRRT